MEPILLYDTTLRDGTQGENITFTAEEKLDRPRLDDMGIHYIEGGWPGSNPRDMEFFRSWPSGKRTSATPAGAFGATRRPGIAGGRTQPQALLDSGTPAVAIFGKTWDLHVDARSWATPWRKTWP
jgi:2-isopropylmalate synthase